MTTKSTDVYRQRKVGVEEAARQGRGTGTSPYSQVRVRITTEGPSEKVLALFNSLSGLGLSCSVDYPVPTEMSEQVEVPPRNKARSGRANPLKTLSDERDGRR